MSWSPSRYDMIELAVHDAQRNGVGFTVCLSGLLCDKSHDESFTGCDWCYKVCAGDPRSAAAHEQEILKIERGH